MSSPQANEVSAGGVPSPANAAPAAGAWAGGPPRITPGAAPPSTPARATDASGLAGIAPANTTPGGTIRVGAGTGGHGPAIDFTVLKSVIDDSIREAISAATTPLHQEIGALRERADVAEAVAASRVASDVDEDSSESEGSTVSSIASMLADKEFYLRVDPKSNRHFGANDIADGGDFKPHRYDLYGHKPWMVLTKNGIDTGGVLGFALSYAEPLALYGKTAYDAADALALRIAEGEEDLETLLESMCALRNNLRETYNIINLFRSLIVQKSRALRPGASEYDKAEVKYLERVFNERDFAAPDTADEIAKLRSRFSSRFRYSSSPRAYQSS